MAFEPSTDCRPVSFLDVVEILFETTSAVFGRLMFPRLEFLPSLSRVNRLERFGLDATRWPPCRSMPFLVGDRLSFDLAALGRRAAGWGTFSSLSLSTWFEFSEFSVIS
jgi:hypothetical protein